MWKSTGMHYKNLKNTRILLCGSKTHKEYLDFIYYKIADRLVLRILDVPYDERKIREIIEDVMKAKRNDNYQKLVETGSDGTMLEAVVSYQESSTVEDHRIHCLSCCPCLL